MQLIDGLVVKDQSGFFTVETTDGKIVTCRLRGRLMEAARSSDITAIGDRVKIKLLEDGTGAIEAVLPRTSVLSRAMRTRGVRGAGQAEREQVIVANADQAIFVFAAKQPKPDFEMLDRFLVAGEASDIEKLVIVVNKIDLEKPGKAQKQFGDYTKMGYTVLYTSALNKEGIDGLSAILKGKLSVFTGPSGVGKTSLLNVMEAGLGRTVKEVGKRSAEGVHTTRDSALIKLEMGGYLADTPGIRKLAVWDVEPDELDALFIDIEPFVEQCKFGNCMHVSEPGCAVLKASEDGALSKRRYKSYIKLRDQLKETYVVY